MFHPFASFHRLEVEGPGFNQPGPLLEEVRASDEERWYGKASKHEPSVSVFTGQEPLVVSLLLVAMPFAPSSVLAPSSKARSP